MVNFASTNLNILKNILIFITFLISTLTVNNPIKANLYNAHDNNLKEKNKLNKTNYILGSGDFLYLVFKGLDSFSDYYLIDSEGYLYLPELGYYYAEGKIIDELKESLEKDYNKFIKEPEIDIILTNKRTITVSLIGEILDQVIYFYQKVKLTFEDNAKPIFN